MMIQLQPLDVIVVDGLPYMPHHWLIRWRGLDKGVHCLTVCGYQGECISPEFAGMKHRNIDHYRGRRVTVHRWIGEVDRNAVTEWLLDTYQVSTGYDFRQWLMGFVLGLTCRRWVDNSQHWTCAELPYWMFQENGCRVTPADEVLPMPRMFRYNPAFRVVFDGVWE